MSNVTQFPEKPSPLSERLGPHRYGQEVFSDGHVVPNMWVVDRGETVEICFPGPVHHIFPREIAAAAIDLAAKAMAIGAGHSHVSSEHAHTKAYGQKAMRITMESAE